MKKLLNKIRLWMIKKLGGYTEQFSHEYKPIEFIHKSYDCWPIVLDRKIIVDSYNLNKIDDIIESVKNDMLYTIIKQLNSNGFVEWETIENFDPDPNMARCIKIKGKILVGKH